MKRFKETENFMAKKLFAAWLVLFSLVICASGAGASEICSKDYFTEKIIILSKKLNIEYKGEYNDTTILKQDAVGIIYNLLLQYDSGFEITDEQAEEILNTCYDNGYLKDENKKAYASFIRHGVIGARGLTYPNRVLTEETCDLLIKRVQSLFQKKLPLTVGGKTICIGSLKDEVYATFGEPSRIEKSEFGFDWFVYSSQYTEFVIIGVRDDVVCAYFTNAAEFEADTKKMNVFTGSDGSVEAVYYNDSPVTESADSLSQGRLLNDIVNAHRVKHALMPFTTPEVEAKPVTTQKVITQEVKSSNCFYAYRNMLKKDDGILSFDFSVGSVIRPVLQEDVWTITAIDSGNVITSFPKLKPLREKNPETVGFSKRPSIKKIVSTAGGINILLDERCADRVLVEVYNREKEEYDVFAYLTLTSETIVIPEYMLTKGNIYNITVVADDKESNMVEYTHGEATEPLAVLSPAKNLVTYDDELEIKAYSSAYRDYRIDVYDKNDKAVSTHTLMGESETILGSLPAGIYHLCITAVSHATGKDMQSEFVTVQIKNPVPVIKEFILEPGQKFEYYYGDGKEFLYFYDTETVAFTEDRIVTVPVSDMLGETDPLIEGEVPVRYEEIKEAVTVYKTKITQRKVPATKKYKKLKELIPERTSTTGAFLDRKAEGSSDIGNAICAMALSYQGVPYLWGGTSPTGFDCSGLVKYICNSLGIKNVARNSALQFETSGVFVEKENLIPGDLVFFQKNGAIHHVGIYIGNNSFVHAPRTGEVVKISSLEEGLYKRQYAGAKRVS